MNKKDNSEMKILKWFYSILKNWLLGEARLLWVKD